MLRQYVDLSCQDEDPDAGARELLGGKPRPRPTKSRAGGGTSPLHLASCRGHVGVVHELLVAGADATRGDQFGFSALHLAARHGFPDVITELLTHSAVLVNLRDESGETAMHTAARYAKTVCLARLLEFGGDVTVESKSGRRAVDVVGQGQDKHNRLSLPHSATQLSGGRRSVKNNTNMPPAQLPRDRCKEERARRLLTVAGGGRGAAWAWPRGDVSSATCRSIPDGDGDKGDGHSDHASPSSSSPHQPLAESEVAKNISNTSVQVAVEATTSAIGDNNDRAEKTASSSNGFVGGSDAARGPWMDRNGGGVGGAAGCGLACDGPRGDGAELSKPPLRRLNVRGLVRGGRGDARVLKAMNRCVKLV